VVRRCMLSRNLVNEEALTQWGAVVPKTNKQTFPMWGRVATGSVRLQTGDNNCTSTDSKHLKYES